MKLLAVVSVLAAVAVASPAEAEAAAWDFGSMEKRDCTNNNCARAVTGTREGKKPDVTSRMSDCSSYQLTTVVTCQGRGDIITTITPTAVPTYADSCNTAAYASACNCWNIPPAITTSATIIWPWRRR
jgi:hypothetical protein